MRVCVYVRGGGVRNAASSSQGQRHAKKLLAIVFRRRTVGTEKKENRANKRSAGQTNHPRRNTRVRAHLLKPTRSRELE